MKHLASLLSLPCIIFLLPVSSTQAADKTWIGGNSVWHDDANWDPAGVPATGDTVQIAHAAVTITQAVTIATMNVANVTINHAQTFTVTNLLVGGGGGSPLSIAGDGLLVGAPGGTWTLLDQVSLSGGTPEQPQVLELRGTTLMQSDNPSASFTLVSQDARIENYGVCELQNDSSANNWGGEGYGNAFVNYDTVRRNTGTETFTFHAGVPFTNAATLEVFTGAIRFGDVFVQTDGQTFLDGTTIQFDRRSAILGGMLRGNGTILGPLTNAATVSPGASAGVLSIANNPFVLPGDYTQTDSGTLAIELGGLTATNQYDVLNVEGQATLAGALNVSLLNGFSPVLGNSFTIVTFGSRDGTFDSFNPPAPHLYAWDIAYTDTNVVISVLNTAPSFAGAQTVHAGPEETPLAFNFSAADADLPAQTLNYSLVSPPSGASIHPATGLFSWTPGEAVGPSTNPVTVIVTDSGTPPLSATNTFQVIVHEVNKSPALQLPGHQVVNELAPVNLNASASDPDLPANPLTMELVSGPAGLDFNPSTGDITWTPTEAQGPGLYPVTIKVTDSNPAATNQTSLSVTNNFEITVNEVNSPPTLTGLASQIIDELALFEVNATATDNDIPANAFTYELVNGPAGLTVSLAGVVSWTPTEEQGPGIHPVTLRVMDNGVPPLFHTNTFQLTVSEVNETPVFHPVSDAVAHAAGTFSRTVTATDADFPANTLAYSLVSGPAGAGIHSGTGLFTWDIPEASAGTTNPVTLRVVDNGVPMLTNTVSFAIVVVDPLTILSVSKTSPSASSVIWNSVSNHVYVLEARTNLTADAWSGVGSNVTATNVTASSDDPAATNAVKFYRVRQVSP